MNISIKKEDRKAGYWNPFIAFPRNWLHQSLFYMDKGERWFRVISEMTAIILLFFSLQFYLPLIINPFLFLIACFIIIHTFNWVLNAQFWCFFMHVCPFLKNPGADITCKYCHRMVLRVEKSNAITAIAVYGSVCRGEWHERSDVDLRFVRNSGFINCIIAGGIAFRERFYATLFRQPLDLYVADSLEWLQKQMRQDETPLFLLKRDEKLEQMFPDSHQISLTPDILNLKLRS